MYSIQHWRRECERSLQRSHARRRDPPLIPRHDLWRPALIGLAAIAFFYAVVLLAAFLAGHL